MAVFITVLYSWRCYVDFDFQDQGIIGIDSEGNMYAVLTNYQLEYDSKITKDSVFAFYIYKEGVKPAGFAGQENDGASILCNHDKNQITEDDNINPDLESTEDFIKINSISHNITKYAQAQAGKRNCMIGIAYSNDPGFEPIKNNAETIYSEDYTATELTGNTRLNLNTDQWLMEVYSTDVNEYPSKRAGISEKFNTLEALRDEDELEGYLTVYYDRLNSLYRNPIQPDRISPNIQIQISQNQEFPVKNHEVKTINTYKIPPYRKWKEIFAEPVE